MNSHLDQIRNWVYLAKSAHYQAEKLAELCETSSPELDEFFGRYFGRAPQEWMDELRIVKAAQLLADGQHLKEVVRELFVCDPANFSAEFKRYHGCAPLKFVRTHGRRRAKQKKQFQITFPGEEMPPEWVADPFLIAWEVLLQQPRRRLLKQEQEVACQDPV